MDLIWKAIREKKYVLAPDKRSGQPVVKVGDNWIQATAGVAHGLVVKVDDRGAVILLRGPVGKGFIKDADGVNIPGDIVEVDKDG